MQQCQKLSGNIRIGKGGSKDGSDLEEVITSKHGDIICINTYLPSGSGGEAGIQGSMDAGMAGIHSPYLSLETPVIVCEDLGYRTHGRRYLESRGKC